MMKLLLALILLPSLLSQTDSTRTGHLTGAVESNSVWYADDKVLGKPDRNWGSNNYVKLDWQKDSLAAGIQAEWYPQALAGYPGELHGASVTGLYFGWKAGWLDLTAGSFHEQLGSGLLLRSWEDRDMGINNCITGGRVALHTPGRTAVLKLLAGLPKYGMWPDIHGMVAGADLSLDLLPLMGLQSSHSLRLEGSVTDRVAFSSDPAMALLASSAGFELPGQVWGWSARLQYAWEGLSVKAEYVGKGPDFYTEALPGAKSQYRLKTGNAELLELVYASGPFSGSITLRRLENMTSRIYLTSGASSIANTLNYLPSLCMQQTYMLAGLNPYETFADGEAGLQGDLYWSFRRGTALGGKYGMKLHVGGSWIQSLPFALPDRDEWRLAYRDINIDLERRWTREFRTVLFVSIQENSPTHGNRKATNAQNVFVLDATYRFSPAVSLRTELQYLYSQELTRDWMAGLLELSLAPHWSVSVSDMYNHGSTGVHYWQAAVSYSLNSLNISLQGGRSREGMVCSGGVCRWQPAYSGAGLRVQWSF